jgi:predicted aldo/keto reductase-like oxidoreductase
MRLPMRKDGKIDEERAVRQIRHAIDQGVNYVDTAWPYHGGESEVVLGKALQDGYRDKVKLATKLPAWMIRRREDMDRYLAAQMKKLGTDRIDYYLLHSLNGAAWDRLHRLDVEGFLDSARQDGRIINPGFSFHGLVDDFTRILDAYPWVFCQIQYNYLDEHAQAGNRGLRYAASKNMGVIVMEPLRGGTLGLVKQPPAVEAIWNEARVRRTPAEWALRWVWNHPEVTVVLSGMNDEQHIEENLSVAETAHPQTFTEEELALVERAGRKYRELMKVGCTGCGYCLPCPSGVMIPQCFQEYNEMHMFGGEAAAKFRYALRLSGEVTEGGPGFASLCVECGSCLDKCPQQIPIPQALAKVAADMEDPAMKDRVAAARRIFKIEAK